MGRWGRWKLATSLGILGGFTLAILGSLAWNMYHDTHLSNGEQVVVGTISAALIAAATKLLQNGNGKNEKP